MTSSAGIPQFNVDYEVNLTSFLRVKTRAKPATLPDLIIRASAVALEGHPRLNASFDDDAIVFHEDVNVGFALDAPVGLIVPVIQRASLYRIHEISTERRRLTDAARSGLLKPPELLTGTFTVSNLGTFGVPRFVALVVPPQSAILAVGAARRDALVLTLSCDHRVVDGADAARFLSELGSSIEDAEWLSTELPCPDTQKSD